MRVRLHHLFIGAAAVAATLGALAGPAHAAPARSTAAPAAPAAQGGLEAVPVAVGPYAVIQYTLKLRTGNVCLSSNSSNYVVVNTCSSSSTYQRWQIGTVNGWSVWINVGKPGKALTTSGSSSGASMSLQTAVGERSQGFVWLNSDSLVYWQGNGALVLSANSNTNGSRVYLKTDTGIGNQRWSLTAH
jgi:hypothetical protein